MPRIRSVKPEVATHEGLFDLEQATKLPIRFAWVMLWTVCDREGRFRWRPRMLKADVLPFDALDFEQVLDALAGAGFIRRYDANGQLYGYIPTWHEHQTVNSRESNSKLPVPPVLTTDTSARTRLHAHAREEGEGELERERERELEREGRDASPPVLARVLAIVSPPPSLPEPDPTQLLPGQIRAGVPGLIGAWNNVAAAVPELSAVTSYDPNDPKLYAALRGHFNIDWWAGSVFGKVAKSDLLRGLVPWRDGTVKAASLWWVIRNADAIAAGDYDNHITVPRSKTITGNRAAADAAKKILA